LRRPPQFLIAAPKITPAFGPALGLSLRSPLPDALEKAKLSELLFFRVFAHGF